MDRHFQLQKWNGCTQEMEPTNVQCLQGVHLECSLVSALHALVKLIAHSDPVQANWLHEKRCWARLDSQLRNGLIPHPRCIIED
jgi:hypothetical protein